MKTYKFKLYSNHGNRELHKTIDGHAHVWNRCIALQRRYYAIYGNYISKFRLINHLSKLKRLPRFVHWNQLPSQAIQDVAARIDKSYKAMFEARAKGKKWGRPRFKPRPQYKSFTLLQVGWKLLLGNRIKIGKCIYTDHEEPDLNRVMTGKIAGFDFGLKRYFTGSNGHDIDSPQFFKRSINAIKRANRNHSRKKKRNRERARLDLARKHRKIANQREDFHWRLAHQLTDEYDEIRLEALNIKGMKSLWGRKVSDLGFADFVSKLKYIASQKRCQNYFH